MAGRIPREFEEGMGNRGAIYIPFPQAVPAKYTVDTETCLFLTKGKCGENPKCLEACEPGAIDFDQEDEIVEFEVGTIIVATGYDIFDARLKPEYGYGGLRQRHLRPGVRAPGLRLRPHRRQGT